MNDKVLSVYGLEDNLEQLKEECAELICACSKYIRCTGKGYKTVADINDTKENIIEEIADVESCIAAVKYFLNISDESIQKISDYKDKRTIDRINGKA